MMDKWADEKEKRGKKKIEIKNRKILYDELNDVNGGGSYNNLFEYYGVWDQLTDEEKGQVIALQKRTQELEDPSYPFEMWLSHAQYEDKIVRSILLKYGVTQINHEDL